jgi:hypothetical protein
MDARSVAHQQLDDLRKEIHALQQKTFLINPAHVWSVVWKLAGLLETLVNEREGSRHA